MTSDIKLEDSERKIVALCAWFEERGVRISSPLYGAIYMGSGIAHIAERTIASGKRAGQTQIVITHQSSRGNSYQRFATREGALKAIRQADNLKRRLHE